MIRDFLHQINGIRFRAGPDGSLLAPPRGSPPPCPEGFEPSRDPYVFVIKLNPCPYRKVKTKTTCVSCKFLWCERHGEKTTSPKCQSCPDNL